MNDHPYTSTRFNSQLTSSKEQSQLFHMFQVREERLFTSSPQDHDLMAGGIHGTHGTREWRFCSMVYIWLVYG